MLGVNPPSGSAWRQTQALLQESHSLFELMTENKGLAIEQMLREYIIPFLKKKMDTKEEISAILDDYQLKKIDSIFVPRKAVKKANNAIINDILSKTPQDLEQGNLVSPEMQKERLASELEGIQESFNELDNQRFITPSEISSKTWKEVLKDFEWDVDVDVTGENKDVQAMMETWSTLLQFFANKQGQPLTPEEKMITGKIMEETGAISAVQLNQAQSQPQPVVAQPQVAPQV
jgi:hypothetical protein